MRPRFSLVTATHRSAHHLQDTAASVLAQRYTNWEWVVVLDGLEPAPFQGLPCFSDARIRLIVLPQNQGRSAARQAGLAATTGFWIGFLDDDDWLYPQHFEVFAKALVVHDEQPAVYRSRYEMLTPAGRKRSVQALFRHSDPLVCYATYPSNIFAWVMPRSAIPHAQFVDYAEAQDYALLAGLLLELPGVSLDETTALYRPIGESGTATLQRGKADAIWKSYETNMSCLQTVFHDPRFLARYPNAAQLAETVYAHKAADYVGVALANEGWQLGLALARLALRHSSHHSVVKRVAKSLLVGWWTKRSQ